MRSQKLAHKASSFSRLQGSRKAFHVLKNSAVCLQIALFSVSLLAAETGVSGASSPLKNASEPVSKQPASFDTAKAQAVDSVAQAKPVRPSAANNERLAILESERRRIVERTSIRAPAVTVGRSSFTRARVPICTSLEPAFRGSLKL